MKSFPRTALVCAALVLSASAHAQQPPAGGQGRNIEAELGITAAQKAKIKTIQESYRPKIMAMQAKYRPQFEALQKQMVDLQKKMAADPVVKKMNSDMEAVFTPAQRAKIKALQAQQAQQRGMMPGAPR